MFISFFDPAFVEHRNQTLYFYDIHGHIALSVTVFFFVFLSTKALLNDLYATQ